VVFWSSLAVVLSVVLVFVIVSAYWSFSEFLGAYSQQEHKTSQSGQEKASASQQFWMFYQNQHQQRDAGSHQAFLGQQS
jgi:Mg2+/Co2+ transporter CorB